MAHSHCDCPGVHDWRSIALPPTDDSSTNPKPRVDSARESRPLLPEEQEAVLHHVTQCVTSRHGIGVNGRLITITLDGLMDALAQRRKPEDFFTGQERQCIDDLVKQGYYVSYEEYEHIPLL